VSVRPVLTVARDTVRVIQRGLRARVRYSISAAGSGYVKIIVLLPAASRYVRMRRSGWLLGSDTWGGLKSAADETRALRACKTPESTDAHAVTASTRTTYLGRPIYREDRVRAARRARRATLGSSSPISSSAAAPGNRNWIRTWIWVRADAAGSKDRWILQAACGVPMNAGEPQIHQCRVVSIAAIKFSANRR